MIVVVTGGRDYNDRGAVWYALTQLNNKHPITELIEGEASGVDTLCREWAEQFNIPVRRCPAARDVQCRCWSSAQPVYAG